MQAEFTLLICFCSSGGDFCCSSGISKISLCSADAIFHHGLLKHITGEGAGSSLDTDAVIQRVTIARCFPFNKKFWTFVFFY